MILAYDSYDEEESFRDIPCEAAALLILDSSPSRVPLPERQCLTEAERGEVLACGGVYAQLAKGKRVSLWQRHTSITKIRHYESSGPSSGSSSRRSRRTKDSHSKRGRNCDFQTPSNNGSQKVNTPSPREQPSGPLHSVIRSLFESFSADQDTQHLLEGSAADGSEIVLASAMDDWSNHRMRRSLRDLDEGCEVTCPFTVSSDEDASPRGCCRLETPSREHHSVVSIVSEALSARRDSVNSMKGRVIPGPSAGESPMGRSASTLLQHETSLLVISKSLSQQRAFLGDSAEKQRSDNYDTNETRSSVAWSNLLKRCGATQKQFADSACAVNSLASNMAIYLSSSDESAGNSQSSHEEECSLQRAVDSLLS